MGVIGRHPCAGRGLRRLVAARGAQSSPGASLAQSSFNFGLPLLRSDLRDTVRLGCHHRDMAMPVIDVRLDPPRSMRSALRPTLRG